MAEAGGLKPALLATVLLSLFAPVPLRAQEFLDRVDDRLTTSLQDDRVRVRVSGALDLEGYEIPQPFSGLVFARGHELFNPRLGLFFDAQIGPRVYVYAQARLDRGFDPTNGAARLRPDEYAVRFTPSDRGAFSFQAGKFATVVGSWAPRHGSWDNPLIAAPLPYENLTGLWDSEAPRTTEVLLLWAGLRPRPSSGGRLLVKSLSLPVIWGPSYASGAAVSGQLGKFNYAFEVKNASLSSRPETWDASETHWRHPTFSGRVGWRPNAMWHLGLSASTGIYLRPRAESLLPAGTALAQYRETVLGQDIAFAWHRVQVWAELYEARFQIPRIGQADTVAGYVETKFKFTPQLFGALRWNQQFYSTLRDRTGAPVRWGRDAWRLDAGPGYRFTAHTQFKVQVSLQRETTERDATKPAAAAQFTVRF